MFVKLIHALKRNCKLCKLCGVFWLQTRTPIACAACEGEQHIDGYAYKSNVIQFVVVLQGKIKGNNRNEWIQLLVHTICTFQLRLLAFSAYRCVHSIVEGGYLGSPLVSHQYGHIRESGLVRPRGENGLDVSANNAELGIVPGRAWNHTYRNEH